MNAGECLTSLGRMPPRGEAPYQLPRSGPVGCAPSASSIPAVINLHHGCLCLALVLATVLLLRRRGRPMRGPPELTRTLK